MIDRLRHRIREFLIPAGKRIVPGLAQRLLADVDNNPQEQARAACDTPPPAANKQLNDAIAGFERALEANPQDAGVYYYLGNALYHAGRIGEAIASYQHTLAINPASAETCFNLGIALRDCGRFEDAAASYRQALTIKPDYADAHNNLGTALRTIGQLEAALSCYRRAIQIQSDFASAHYNQGIVLHNLGRMHEAQESNCNALTIKPDLAEAHDNLGTTRLALGQLDEAVQSYKRALAVEPDFILARSNLLFAYNYLLDLPAAVPLKEAQDYGRLVAQAAKPFTHWENHPDPHRCLRVGLVSGDLRHHPVGFFIEGVLAALACDASSQLTIFAYPTLSHSDAVTERIQSACRGWHVATALSDENLAAQIRNDGIDILIDLSGHTEHNRLPMFARKPAPVQVSWLGYFATSGVAAIDYLIADPCTLPTSEDKHFTEKIWRLPETRLCFTPPDAEIKVSPLPALENGFVTFACFNNPSKINDAVIALWAKVLQATPGSRLFLKAKSLHQASSRQHMQERLAAHGIDADRLILEGASPRNDYLAAYHRVDISLDTFPYTGGATSAESLWMGVPVLSLAGERFISRQGLGLLTNAGLPEWVAHDHEDYLARAVRHAADLHSLVALRKGLRQQALTSPIFDAPRFARHFETALRGMWTQWCRQAGCS